MHSFLSFLFQGGTALLSLSLYVLLSRSRSRSLALALALALSRARALSLSLSDQSVGGVDICALLQQGSQAGGGAADLNARIEWFLRRYCSMRTHIVV